MDIDLHGRRALVCGASQGIGKAVAIELAALGADVILLARNEALLSEITAKLPNDGSQVHRHFAVDFKNLDQVRSVIDKALEQCQAFHILVNNSGGPKAGLAKDAHPSEYLDAFSQHLLCSQILVQALVPGMRQEAYGRIVNITSTSVKQPIPGLGVSNCIRAAVANWAKTLAGELAIDGITVNNLLPGATDTKRLAELYKIRAKNDGVDITSVIKNEKKKIPLARFAKPEEIAASVAFLVSPSAGYITGINLPVDGGRTGCL